MTMGELNTTEQAFSNMFTTEELQTVEAIRARYPTSLAALMPVLHFYQDKYQYVSLEGMQYISRLLDVPVEHILGVVTFYEMYHEHPLGKFNLQVCTNVSCLLRDSDMVLDVIRKKIGIGPGETTADKKFTVHEAECLGSCGTAPMMSVNKDYHENLTRENVSTLIDQLLATT